MLLITRNSRVAALAMSAAAASRYGSGDVFLKDAILRIRSPGAWSNRRSSAWPRANMAGV